MMFRADFKVIEGMIHFWCLLLLFICISTFYVKTQVNPFQIWPKMLDWIWNIRRIVSAKMTRSWLMSLNTKSLFPICLLLNLFN